MSVNEWALLQHGRIANVVMTHCSKAEVEQAHPTYVVRDLYSLPPSLLEQYEHWGSRP